MRRAAIHNRRQAQSIIETVVGIIFLIPIVLFLFDVGILVLGNTANDQLAKQAARAAAGATAVTGGAPDAPGSPTYWTNAQAAANGVITRYQQNKSGFITNISLKYLAYNDTSTSSGTGSNHAIGSPPGPIPADPGNGNCEAVTQMQVNVPVAFPGLTSQVFTAKAVEPITTAPP